MNLISFPLSVNFFIIDAWINMISTLFVDFFLHKWILQPEREMDSTSYQFIVINAAHDISDLHLMCIPSSFG